MREVEELNAKISSTKHELRVLELNDKNKENELKLVYFRQKEIEKVIADYKKL